MEESLTTEEQPVKAHVLKSRRARVDVTLPIRFTDLKGKFRHGKTKNISTGGVFILNANTMMPVGVFTDLCIDLPNDPPILVYGQVVWTNRHGFGIRFMNLQNGDKDKIRNIVRNKGRIAI